MPSLPYSKNKRYLLGIDWVIAALDKVNKSRFGIGNHSLIVLKLDGQLDFKRLKNHLDKALRDIAVIKGRPSRDLLNLAPCWKTNANFATQYSFDVKDVDGAGLDAVWTLFNDFANQGFVSSKEYISFLLCKQSTKSYLGFKFDHRILDARGAEALLSYVSEFDVNNVSNFDYPQEPYLRNWKDKFKAGQTINQFLRSLNKGLEFNSLEHKTKSRDKILHVSKVFSIEQTKRIEESANKTAGYLMLLPYLLGRSMQVFDKEFFEGVPNNTMFTVPVNMDRRGRKVKQENIFFNQVSFFYFNTLKEVLSDDKELFKTLRSQWYSQMKNKIPEAFELASRLIRIAPLNIFAKVMQKQLKNHPAAFSFSFIGEEGYTDDDFLGLKVKDIYHMPVVPYLPGVGIFFTKFKGNLKLVVCALDTILDKTALDSLAQSIAKRLVADYDI